MDIPRWRGYYRGGGNYLISAGLPSMLLTAPTVNRLNASTLLRKASLGGLSAPKSLLSDISRVRSNTATTINNFFSPKRSSRRRQNAAPSNPSSPGVLPSQRLCVSISGRHHCRLRSALSRWNRLAAPAATVMASQAFSRLEKRGSYFPSPSLV